MANNRLTSFLQRLWNRNNDQLESDAMTKREAKSSTARGDPNFLPTIVGENDLSNILGVSLLGEAADIFTVGDNYIDQVWDCTRLAERNIVFKAIVDKLARTVAEPVTQIDIPLSEISSARADKVRKIFAQLMDRTDWECYKDTFIRRLLNEGGLSWELIVSNTAREEIRSIEYRPHHFIRPIVNKDGRFESNKEAYRQIEVNGSEITTFARWQLVDINLIESAYHNRGVPHLAAARTTLENVGMMIRGLVQKWIRAGGALEHFNMEDAQRWGDVENFKNTNLEAIEASPDSLVRQFFTKGKVKIERVPGEESGKHDTAVVDFLLELIFMAAGTPKVAMGFESNAVIKDAADLAWQNYLQTLDMIERRLFIGLDRAFQFELLLHGILPESIPYRFVGGEFKPKGALDADKDSIEAGSLSINDIRRARGFEPDPDPVFDIPGLLITQEMAESLALEREVAPKWLVKKVREREKRERDMAKLAAQAAISAAENNDDPDNTDGKRPPSGTPSGGANPNKGGTPRRSRTEEK